MRKPFLFFVSLLASQAIFAQQSMNNEAVIKMVKAGLADPIVISTIQSAAGQYDISSDGLIALKNAGVDDAVIAAVVSKKAGPGMTYTSAPANPDDPNATHEAGIYIYDAARAADHKMIELDPSVYSQAKTGGALATAYTYGIVKAKAKAIIRSAHSNARVTDPNVSFYFFFEQTSAGLSHASSSGGTTTTPNEFTLLRFDIKGDTRETVIGKYNAYGSQSGNDDKAIVSFSFEKIRPGVYKVTPKAPLSPGEYGFVSASGTAVVGFFGAAMTSSGSHVFDFGVN